MPYSNLWWGRGGSVHAIFKSVVGGGGGLPMPYSNLWEGECLCYI